MSVKKQYEIGFWIKGEKGVTEVIEATATTDKLLDCCPRCGNQLKSLHEKCCESSELHDPLSSEVQQQLLLNWMAAACVEEDSSGPWHCSRSVLLGQWLCQGNQKHWLLSKRRLPDRNEIEQVWIIRMYYLVVASSFAYCFVAAS